MNCEQQEIFQTGCFSSFFLFFHPLPRPAAAASLHPVSWCCGTGPVVKQSVCYYHLKTVIYVNFLYAVFKHQVPWILQVTRLDFGSPSLCEVAYTSTKRAEVQPPPFDGLFYGRWALPFHRSISLRALEKQASASGAEEKCLKLHYFSLWFSMRLRKM